MSIDELFSSRNLDSILESGILDPDILETFQKQMYGELINPYLFI